MFYEIGSWSLPRFLGQTNIFESEIFGYTENLNNATLC
jgi:hypothetical protein